MFVVLLEGNSHVKNHPEILILSWFPVCCATLSQT